MIEVSAAIIFIKNKILCVQRGNSKYDYVAYKYEFPGGKLNNGEDPIKALKREITEELMIDIKIKEKFKTIFHKYPDFELKMHCYICYVDNFKGILYEHINYKLMSIKNIDKLDWIEADIELVKNLKQKYLLRR
tara:strand:- start:101 stop:502 length:402 start_codon:yes stop_codon:yes gene_type:complete